MKTNSLFTAFRQINRLAKSLTKNDKRTQTQSGRQNVQKLRQQLTARFRYAGNLLHSKISVRFKLQLIMKIKLLNPAQRKRAKR